MIHRLGLVCHLLAAAAAASGQCRVHHRDIHVQAALALEYPAYGPVYSGRGTSDDDTRKILRLLEGMEQRLRSLEGHLSPASKAARLPAAGEAHPALAVFAANCAACHEKTTAKKGGGFAFLEGDQFAGDIDAVQLGLIGAHVRSGHMPPAARPKLAAKEVGAITAYVDGLFVAAKGEK